MLGEILKGKSMVSIIVPIYNSEQRIAKCIESILSQTFKDFELILINDGSKDKSLEICREYEEKDNRIRVLTQENSGVSATRNRGIECAKGEYIQFVDSDDYIAPNMVEQLVMRMKANDVDMVICGILKHYENYNEEILPEKEGKIYMNELEERYPSIFGNYILHSPVNKLYKKELIKSTFPTELSLGEDYTFNLNYLIESRSIYFIRESYYFYVISENSLISTYREDCAEIAEQLYLKGIEFCNVIGLKEMAKSHLSGIFLEALFYGFSDIYTLSNKNTVEKRKYMKKWINNNNVKNALVIAKMRRPKHKVELILLKHRMSYLLHVVLLFKGWIRCRKN